MCQATVYLNDQQVAEDVIWLEPAEEGVELRTLFEEPQIIPGIIVGIDFLRHRVLLEPIEGREDG